MRGCLRGYNLSDFLSAAQSPSSNRISYHRDSFRDSAQQLANCMESTFPGNKFPVVRNIVPGFNYAASIYFNNKLQAATDPEPPTIPNISIGISEEGFRTAANSLNNELVNNGIKNTSVKVRSSRTYRTPLNNEPSDDKDVLNAESLIKRVINKYFPATQYKIVYDTYLTNNVIEVFIEKIAKPKARVSKVQFPKTINVKDKFLISFDIGLENYNGVTGVHYGTIYLEGPWNSFEDFTFPGNAAARTTISKGDVGKFANLSIGKYEVRVEVKEFGLDTSLGFVTVQSAPAPVRAGYCDTVYFNIGNNGKKIYYRENAYISNAFEGRDVTLYAKENNIKFTKFNITIKGCVSQDFTVSTGETKNISLCNGKSLIIKKLDWSNTSAAFSNSAIFDVIICKPVPAGL